MPPKQRADDQRFAGPIWFYQHAYRERIKVIRPRWKPTQTTITLHWMWKYVATDAEKAECNRLHAANSDDDLEPDDATIPLRVKQKGAPPPPPTEVVDEDGDEEGGEVNQEDLEEEPEDEAREPGPLPQDEGTPALAPDRGSNATPAGINTTPAGVNTTAFTFWPAVSDSKKSLPVLNNKVRTRKFLEAGLLYTPEEAHAKRWHGAQVLGNGSSGMVMLWARTDATGHIERTIAVRDLGSLSRDTWVSPFYWRDRLPREIDVHIRLDEQKGYERNIQRYFGHRLDMAQRRYRVFTNVCEFGDLMSVLSVYSGLWRRRHDIFRWLETHPRIGTVKTACRNRVARGEMSEEQAEKQIRANHAACWAEYVKVRNARVLGATKEAPKTLKGAEETAAWNLRTAEEFDDMSVIQKSGEEGIELDDALPPVIPEAFLWHIFGQLLDAVSVLHEGNGQTMKDKKWKEIVHRDIHILNILVKPVEKGEGTLERQGRQSSQEVSQGGDFDRAFFDLQDGEDSYDDNPYHYLLGVEAAEFPGVGARYPPEHFGDYAGHENNADMENLTSKSDLFSVGQVMWHLVMNLPSKHGRNQCPFFDNTGTDGQVLVNGKPYDNDELSAERGRFMSGQSPYEASSLYSKELKDLIRMCLRYRQEDRPTVRKLRDLVELYAAADLETKATGELLLTMPRKIQDLRVGMVYSP